MNNTTRRRLHTLAATLTIALAATGCATNNNADPGTSNDNNRAAAETSLSPLNVVDGYDNTKPTYNTDAPVDTPVRYTPDGKWAGYVVKKDSGLTLNLIDLNTGETKQSDVAALSPEVNTNLTVQDNQFVVFQTGKTEGTGAAASTMKWKASLYKTGSGELKETSGDLGNNVEAKLSEPGAGPMVGVAPVGQGSLFGKQYVVNTASGQAAEYTEDKKFNTTCTGGKPCSLPVDPVVALDSKNTISTYNELKSGGDNTVCGDVSNNTTSNKGCATGFTNGTLDSQKLAPAGADPQTGAVRAANDRYILGMWFKKGQKGTSIFKVIDVQNPQAEGAVFEGATPGDAQPLATPQELHLSPNGKYGAAGSYIFQTAPGGKGFAYDSHNNMEQVTISAVNDEGVGYATVGSTLNVDEQVDKAVTVTADGQTKDAGSGVLLPVAFTQKGEGVFYSTGAGVPHMSAYPKK